MRKAERILAVLVMCMLTTAGAWMGTKIEEKQVESQEAYKEGIRTTVAIVNQDTGVIVDGVSTNYAGGIVETLGSGYTVASATAAENGMKEGNYGAIILFPPDFSKNIVSVNEKNPKQALIEMTIHPDLPEEKYIALHDQLFDLQQQINNVIASTYVEAVFVELHSAQDEISTLLNNDEKDMKAVENVQLAKYTENLNLGQLPLMQYDTSQANYAELREEAHSVARDMNEIYTDSYKQAQEDFEIVQKEIIDQEQNVMEQNSVWVSEVELWAEDITCYAQDISDYKQELDDWITDSSSYIGEANAFLATVGDVDQYLQGQITNINNYQQGINNWHMLMTGSLEAVKAKGESVANYSQNLRTKMNEISPLLQPEVYAEICAMLDGVEAEVGALQSSVQAVGANPPGSLVVLENKPEMNPAPPTALPEVPKFEKDTPDMVVPGQPTELTDALNDLVDIYTEFNPNEYMNAETTEKALENMSKYDKHLSGVESMIADVNAENREQMHTIYEGYNDYVNELRTEITDVHEREQKNLAVNIGELTDVLTETSVENHSIMDSFVTRMPNSRQRSSVNQRVISNTVQPVTYSYEYVRTNPKQDMPNVEIYIGIGMVVMIAMAGAVILYTWWRDKAAEKKAGKKLNHLNFEKAA